LTASSLPISTVALHGITVLDLVKHLIKQQFDTEQNIKIKENNIAKTLEKNATNSSYGYYVKDHNAQYEFYL